MPDGLIVKALSGYYYVLPDGADAASSSSSLVQCRARGVFKKRGIAPLVGDRISFAYSENNEGTVTEIHKRQSELIRPPVANIEQAVLVFSLDEPALNLQLLDKFLVHIEHSGLEAVICFSKQDLVKGPAADSAAPLDTGAVRELYEEIGYRVFVTSAKEGEGLEPVRGILKERLSVFSGQSGVGKSTLLNALLPELNLETGEISMRLGRGRHTTRHVELLPLPGGGWVADTPGFSQLDFMEMEPEDLGRTFREFVPLSEECRFRGCLHHKEPGCRVREAAENGTVAASRYEHYQIFLQEMKDRKRRY